MTNDPSSPVLIDQSIEWLGALPDSWTPCRVKDILRSDVYGISNATESTGEIEVLGMGDIVEGKIVCPGKRFVDEVDSRLLLRKDDLLFNRTNSIALVGKVGLVERDILNVTFASYLVRLRLNRNHESRFWTYFLNSQQFGAWMRSHAIQTANQANLSSYKLRQFEVFEVREDEQKAIASYLDRETERIDRKVGLLEEKALLYKELKQSLINETVTRGLDLSTPLRDSGVNWIGDIPEHWDVKRGKDIYQEVKTVSTTGEEDLLSVSEYTGVTPKQRDVETGENSSRAASLVGYRKCKEGDLITNIMLAWKRGLGVAPCDGIVSPAYAVYRHEKNTHPKFMHYLLRNDQTIWEFKRNSSGIIESRLRLYTDDFFAMEFAQPGFVEQKAIAEYLDGRTAKIDQIVEAIAEHIRLLKELRKTLINDVVTGKVRVSETEGGAA
ncbi:MAG: restriction endonuclease subunit S [Verrucomicrobiota bacterium]